MSNPAQNKGVVRIQQLQRTTTTRYTRVVQWIILHGQVAVRWAGVWQCGSRVARQTPLIFDGYVGPVHTTRPIAK